MFSVLNINVLLFQYLKEAKLIDDTCIVKPNIATKNDLQVVHTKKYLRSLQVRL